MAFLDAPSRLRPHVLSLLRMAAAFTFMCHGMQKLFGFPVAFPMPHLPTQFLIAGIIEAFGGILLFLGLFTRPVAFLASGEMAVAFWTVHARTGLWPIRNGGELPVLYCFIWLYFAFAGAGDWSLDALLWRRRPATV